MGDGLFTFPREESINVVATDSQIREITSVQVKLGFLNTQVEANSKKPSWEKKY